MNCLRRALLASAAAALLGACATVDKGPGPVGASISGRMAVQVDASPESPARSFGASFDLLGTPATGQLNLSSPLGTVLAQARWSPQTATLTTSEGQRDFATLETLTAEMLGESLPLAALFDWLRGRPWDEAPSEAHESGFRQLGWSVHTDRLQDGWVVAQRQRAPMVVVRVRLEP